jgi:hypothetical protein
LHFSKPLILQETTQTGPERYTAKARICGGAIRAFAAYRSFGFALISARDILF